MAGWRGALRPGRWLGIVFGALFLAAQAQAQDAPALLTLDQDRFFLESAFGRAVVDRERVATAALEQENKRIEAELIAEEQALTDLRGTLPAEEFSAKADAFDQKVERIRAEQDAKARVLTDARERDRQAFLKAAVPVLAELLGERKATAILDKDMVIVSLSAVDITDEAIAKLDAAQAGPPTAP